MTTLHCVAGCGREFTSSGWLTLHYGMSNCSRVIYGEEGSAVRKAYLALMDAYSRGDSAGVDHAQRVLSALLARG